MLFSPASSHAYTRWISLCSGFDCFWIVSVIVIGIALRKTSQTLGERQVPLMGVLAAAIFAGRDVSFSVSGGTSGHLLGAAIAVILLGPWPVFW